MGTSNHLTHGRGAVFRDGIRARDGGCVVTGSVNLMAPDDWSPFEAAHIFPLEKESLWIAGEFQRWISDMEDK